MSSEKYATEENIRTLITLVRDELSNYVKKSDYVPGEGGTATMPDLSNYVTKAELEKYVTWDDFNKAIQALPGGSGIRFEKDDYTLPDEGEPGVIYMVLSDDKEQNKYDEYIWDADEECFELLGPTTAVVNYVQWDELLPMLAEISQGNTLKFELVDVLPETSDADASTIYFLLVNQDGGNNEYDEYVYLEELGRFEKIGTNVSAPGE